MGETRYWIVVDIHEEFLKIKPELFGPKPE